MSLFDRVVNRLTANPEADEAYNKQLAENRDICKKEIAMWEAKLSSLDEQSFKNSTRPDDLLYLKQFIKTRILALRPLLLSQSDIDTFNNSQDMQNYKIMMGTREIRFRFQNIIDQADPMYKRTVDDLKARKIPEPPELKQLVQLAKDTEIWLKKTIFAEKDVYEAKEQEVRKRAAEIMKDLQADLQNPDAVKKAAAERHNAERDTFSVGRLTAKAFGIVFTVVACFLLIFFGLFGASLATNLNLYRATAFRILYAIYGFLYCFLVIPYVLLYRWWWKGKRPRFYSFIPLVPYHFDNYYAGLLFSWMSYRPDDQIEALKEWNIEQKEHE